MEAEQNELIKQCLMQEYSVGGVAGMGELLAEANGIGQEYAILITRLSICCNVIIAALDGSGYFSPKTKAYNQFNIKIGQIQTAQVYDARLAFLLPYAVQAWTKNEPLQLHLLPHTPHFFNSHSDRLNAISMQFKIAMRVWNYIKNWFGFGNHNWVVAVQIEGYFGKTIIPKSE